MQKATKRYSYKLLILKFYLYISLENAEQSQKVEMTLQVMQNKAARVNIVMTACLLAKRLKQTRPQDILIRNTKEYQASVLT